LIMKASIIPLTLLLPFALAWQESCSKLKFQTDIAELVDTIYYAPGDLVNITNLASSITTTKLPGFCRAQIRVHTNRTSGNYASTEVWLPDEWNERFMGIGNGGFGGGVIYADLGFSAVTRGFAGMSTNQGHNSSAFDVSWAYNDTQAVIDNGYRAIQLSTIAGKDVAEAYYGKRAKTNIWSSCSTGGRQGLVFAQRYADFYDGIVVGSPAAPVSRLDGRNIHIVLKNGTASYVDPSQWPILQEAVLKKCDTLDGVADGVITNPTACSKVFDLDSVACGAKQTAGCFTSAQLEAIRTKLYADYYEDGFFVVKGFNLGSEGEWAFTVGSTYETGLGAGLGFKAFLYNNPNWDSETQYNKDALLDFINTNPGDTDAFNPDVSAFQKAGGKLMQYAGLSDAFVTEGFSDTYYNSVEDFFKKQGKDDIRDFYRFYEVPGMGHCGGGNGVNAFGNSGSAADGLDPISSSPENDIVYAMVDWVEKGRQPDIIVAAHYKDNNGTLGIEFTRPLCVYPKRAHYDGGDQNKAASFSCQ